MITVIQDDVIINPEKYIDDILSGSFCDVPDGEKVFKNIQPRDHDEFYYYILAMFPDYKVSYNFVRMSPHNQEEPNFIHRDDMMGDLTCILYLNKQRPASDGTTIYDENENPLCVVYSKMNRMFVFDSKYLHSRNIYENFGEGRYSRLIQVIFLKKK